MENILPIISSFLQAAIRLSVPLIITGVGMLYTERCGVLNIGVEGSMLIGTFAAVAGAKITGNSYFGIFLAVISGGVLSLMFAYLAVSRRADQLVAGFGINLLASGVTLTLLPYLNAVASRAALIPKVKIEFLIENIPFIGPIFFDQPITVWIALILTLISSWILYNTSWGLNMRAVGENSGAVATVGLSVIKLRYVGILLGGLFAGFGGAALALNDIGYFVPNMTESRGFIVLAALVVSRWDPIYFLVVCMLFGAADAIQLRAQTFGSTLPYQLYLMLPYLLTIAALAGLVGKTRAPKEYTEPYDPTQI